MQKNKASNRNRTDNWTLRVTCFTVELWKPISKYYKKYAGKSIVLKIPDKKFLIKNKKSACNLLFVCYSITSIEKQMSVLDGQ